MAKPKPQQSSLKKYLFIGGGVLLVVLLFPTGGQAPKTGQSKVQQMMANGGGSSKNKKEDPYNTKADIEAKFERVAASQKNSFVPLVTKRDFGTPLAPNGIPAEYAGGEGTWSYTGNMTVDGTPNALFENSSTGEGVFLRPGQHWKTLRLVSVKDDSIVIEGPSGATKTVYFNDLNAMPATPEVITPLPAVGPGNFNPATSNPNGSGGGFGRQNRNRPLADNSGLSGPIGQANAFEPSIDSQDQQNNQFNNRRNRNRRNNENNLN